MRPYGWLILDADGTLFDFQRAEARALQVTPIQMRLRVPPEFASTYHTINDSLWKQFESGELRARDVRHQRFERLFEDLPLTGDPQAFSETFLKNLIRESTFLEGAEAFLSLARNCSNLVLMTNGFADVQRARIEQLGLEDMFDHVIISEELGVAKPSQGIFDIAFEHMGYPGKAAVLIVGDSLSSDIRGGADYGIDTCWFNPERRANTTGIEPTYEVRYLDEIVQLLASTEANCG
ncbi:YjjG family noncanonical pyrimidine nucleotidase [Candidatus Bipolaricaulota bacterium]